MQMQHKIVYKLFVAFLTLIHSVIIIIVTVTLFIYVCLNEFPLARRGSKLKNERKKKKMILKFNNTLEEGKIHILIYDIILECSLFRVDVLFGLFMFLIICALVNAYANALMLMCIRR